MKKALITGISGQDGSYLSKLLIEKGYEVTGVTRNSGVADFYRLKYLKVFDNVKIIDVDLTDYNLIHDLVKDGDYDEIYNLAGQSYVSLSWDDPIGTSFSNSLLPLYFLEAIRKTSKRTKFFQASSSEMFGGVGFSKNEDSLFDPTSPYAVSKQFSHNIAQVFRNAYEIHAVNGILFNHESPLRGTAYVTKKIISSLVEVHLGTRNCLCLGNLNISRDWGYAPEYVDGMWRSMQHHCPNDFVFATGVSTSLRQFCSRTAKALGFSLVWEGEGLNEVGVHGDYGVPIVKVSEQFYRPVDLKANTGDASKALDKLGWRPKKFVDDIIEIMVNHELKIASRF